MKSERYYMRVVAAYSTYLRSEDTLTMRECADRAGVDVDDVAVLYVKALQGYEDVKAINEGELKAKPQYSVNRYDMETRDTTTVALFEDERLAEGVVNVLTTAEGDEGQGVYWSQDK